MCERATAAVKTPDVKPARAVSQTRQADIDASPTSIPEQIAVLHRTIGNQGVVRLYRTGILQAKLKIGQPNDIYEQEADRVADDVMRMLEPTMQMKPERIMRREEEPTHQQIASDRHLRRLAVWPCEALDEWRRLNSGEQMVVVLYMAGNYGHDFASQFLTHARLRRRPEPVAHWTNILTETSEQLQRRGYRFVVTSMGIEHWVHPSGNSLHRILPSHRSEQERPLASTERIPSQEQSSPPARQEEPENPPRINPSSDPDAAYGPAVHSRDGAEIMGQGGRAFEHEDGTILLYPPGSRTPITYRLRPGASGAYDYYGPDGVKAENVIIMIDPDELFRAAGG